jgi:predicted nucleic acid-binding protein
MRTFVDTNIWIYHLEGQATLGQLALMRLAKIVATGGEVVVSDLVRLECRVGPLKARNTVLLEKYDGLFARSDIFVQPLSARVCDLAASLRADFGVKTPDALNLASALDSGCQIFLTHDARLQAFSKLTVESL